MTTNIRELLADLRQQAATRKFKLPDDRTYFSAPHAALGRYAVFCELIQRVIVRRAVGDLIAAGYSLRVHGSADYWPGGSRDLDEVMGAVMEEGGDLIECIPPAGPAGHRAAPVANLFCRYGKCTWSVLYIPDSRLKGVLAGAEQLASEIGHLV